VGGFEATRGFGIAFQTKHKEDVFRRFPFLRPVWAVAHDVRAEHRDTFGYRTALSVLLPSIDAYYVNVLQVPAGAGVSVHVDATLHSAVRPHVVAVLYLQVPHDAEGGRLCVHHAEQHITSVEPRPNRLVLFLGNLPHEVEPVTRGTSTTASSMLLRTSMVIEMYALGWWRRRSLVPKVRIQGNGFAALLHRAE
jgi:predicted 2-oxoglutarate/Fe(II)-dependent dioxygenase YbiX